MLFRSLIADTARALFLGTTQTIALPFYHETQEAAAAYTVMEWEQMRQPYQSACVLAALAFHAHGWLLYRCSISSLNGLQVQQLLQIWLRFPLTPPGDFVRAMTMFSFMSLMDQSQTWEALSLQGYERYTYALRLYHDLLAL
jgi:hypothetical protein